MTDSPASIAVPALRFAASYTDRSGVLRFHGNAPETSAQQLGLSLLTDDE